MTRTFTHIDDPRDVDVVPADEVDADAAIVRIVEPARVVDLLMATELLDVLAERTSAIVDELETRGLAAIAPTMHERVRPRRRWTADLVFPAQTVLVGWDEELDRVVLEAWSPIDEDDVGDVASLPEDDAAGDVLDDDPLGPDVVRVRMAPPMAATFARRAAVAAAGTGPLD